MGELDAGDLHRVANAVYDAYGWETQVLPEWETPQSMEELYKQADPRDLTADEKKLWDRELQKSAVEKGAPLGRRTNEHHDLVVRQLEKLRSSREDYPSREKGGNNRQVRKAVYGVWTEFGSVRKIGGEVRMRLTKMAALFPRMTQGLAEYISGPVSKDSVALPMHAIQLMEAPVANDGLVRGVTAMHVDDKNRTGVVSTSFCKPRPNWKHREKATGPVSGVCRMKMRAHYVSLEELTSALDAGQKPGSVGMRSAQRLEPGQLRDLQDDLNSIVEETGESAMPIEEWENALRQRPHLSTFPKTCWEFAKRQTKDPHVRETELTSDIRVGTGGKSKLLPLGSKVRMEFLDTWYKPCPNHGHVPHFSVVEGMERQWVAAAFCRGEQVQAAAQLARQPDREADAKQVEDWLRGFGMSMPSEEAQRKYEEDAEIFVKEEMPLFDDRQVQALKEDAAKLQDHAQGLKREALNLKAEDLVADASKPLDPKEYMRVEIGWDEAKAYMNMPAGSRELPPPRPPSNWKMPGWVCVRGLDPTATQSAVQERFERECFRVREVRCSAEHGCAFVQLSEVNQAAHAVGRLDGLVLRDGGAVMKVDFLRGDGTLPGEQRSGKGGGKGERGRTKGPGKKGKSAGSSWRGSSARSCSAGSKGDVLGSTAKGFLGGGKGSRAVSWDRREGKGKAKGEEGKRKGPVFTLDPAVKRAFSRKRALPDAPITSPREPSARRRKLDDEGHCQVSEHRGGEEQCELSERQRRDLRSWLVATYRRCKPENEEKVDYFLDKYQGQEKLLHDTVCKKYQEDFSIVALDFFLS